MKRTSIPNPSATPIAPKPSLLAQANAPLQLTEDFLRRFPEARSKTMRPALPGSIQNQYKRCGKENCRCAKGKLHGPYSYLIFRKGGKFIKRYIRADELDTVILLCAAMAARKRNSKVIIAKCKQFRDNLKKLKQVFNFLERLSHPPPRKPPKEPPKVVHVSRYWHGTFLGTREEQQAIWAAQGYPFDENWRPSRVPTKEANLG